MKSLKSAALCLFLAGCGVGSNSPNLPAQGVGKVTGLRVLSNRADLLSNGDALVEVLTQTGDSAPIKVDVDGRDVSSSFERRADGRTLGIVTGLKQGSTVLTARNGTQAGYRLPLTNYPPEGPIFSGPHLTPWNCTAAANGLAAPDAECNSPAVVSYQYKDTGKAAYQAYDPASPPPDSSIATTTNDEGKIVRYIVRRERGTLNRGIYDIAFLHDPAHDPEPAPWALPAGWNHKFVFSFGSGCAPGYTQAAPEDPMLAPMLDRGYAVAVSSTLKFGNSCSSVLAAETMMMIKEHLSEILGPPRYTIGNNCSGGAEAQHTISDNYPGLLDAIRPECTFADGWTPAILSKADCALLLDYFTNTSPQLWASSSEQSAVVGSNVSMCIEMRGLGSGTEDFDPTTGCQLAAAQQYNASTNPTGARCTLQDYNVNYLGRRASDGFANKVIDYVGIQWGLKALQGGAISVAQFVDINEKIGSYDIDMKRVPERTAADLTGLERMYRNGMLTYAANQALIPSIDTRANNQYDFHGNIHREIIRNRVVRSVGNHDSQVHWLEPTEVAFGTPTPQQKDLTLVKVDEWLKNIFADASGDPLSVKVARNRPADVKDGCYSAGVPADQASCDAIYTHQLLPRLVAGEPNTADILKCQLKPFDANDADYTAHGITFTPAQVASLQSAFPTGVCDWTQPGVGQQLPAGYWLDFTHGYDGVPLAAPPVATPVS